MEKEVSSTRKAGASLVQLLPTRCNVALAASSHPIPSHPNPRSPRERLHHASNGLPACPELGIALPGHCSRPIPALHVLPWLRCPPFLASPSIVREKKASGIRRRDFSPIRLVLSLPVPPKPDPKKPGIRATHQ
jgi:hypothetical protein